VDHLQKNVLEYSQPLPVARRAFSWKRLLKAVAVILVVFGCIYPFSQMHHMRQAAAHAVIIKAQIANDSRFNNVRIGPGTQDNGCLFVSGAVRSQGDLSELKDIITQSKPPVTVRWFVEILP
jgi:hypothetical protein